MKWNRRMFQGSSPSVWEELLKSLPSIVTAITAIYGVTIAKAGLYRWERETIGKRKIDLAEEVLADVYRFRVILRAARSLSGSWFHAGIKKEAEETEDEARYRNAIYWPIQTLTEPDTNEFFGQLAARRYRFMATFGPEADRPFTELAALQDETLDAAFKLVKNYRDTPLREPYEKSEWEQTIGWRTGSKDDSIKQRLEAAITEIELLCRPHLGLNVKH